MPDTSELSETKRILLEKYLREGPPQISTSPSMKKSSVPLSYADARVPVVPIQTGGSKRPLFYLHVHVIGGAFYGFTLAHDLGPDQPFYILDPYLFNDKEFPPTLETIAAAYIESLHTVQPEGPYLLAGFCGGGIIAFEMAQQLHAQGQEVELLVLIEPRDGPAPHRMLARKLFGNFIRGMGTLLRFSREKQLEIFLRIRYVILNVAGSRYRIEKKFRLFPSTVSLRNDWTGVFVWIISHYKTRQFPGKATYFWAREEPKYLRTWWGKIAEAKELEVHLIPGTHDTCRTEHLHEMAEHLNACLNKIQVTTTT